MQYHAPIALLVLGAAASLCSAQTFLGPVPYTSSADSPFDTLSPSFVLENFESGTFNIPGVTGNGIGIVGPRSNTDSVDVDDGVIDGSGTNGRSYFANGQIGITFTFDAAILGGLPTQVGVVWTDGAGTTSFEAFDGSGLSLGVIGPFAIADDTFFGTTGEDRFFGIIDAAGIGSIRITNTSGGIEVDHLQFIAGGGCVIANDIDGDGQVGAADLALLLGSWGPCGAGCCSADLDQDGAVGGPDLAILLGAWGS